MFLAGSFIVLCGLLAQSTAQLAGLPYPLGQDLPMSMGHCRSLHVGQTLPYYGVTPVVSTYPSDHLDRNFRDGESLTVSSRYVCVCARFHIDALDYPTSQS